MKRRSFVVGAAACASGASLTPRGALAQSSKPVFLNYSQAQLDQAYDQSVWAPQVNELLAYDASSSAAVRKTMPPRTVRYGKSEIEQADIFAPPNARGAPVLVYIHGGAWILNSRLDASFPAPTVVGRGAIHFVPDYANAKQARLAEMIEQVRGAVEWAARNAASFGGDPDRIYIAGHSSGGHLASCALITDWAGRGLPADAIKGGLLMSGMFDLHPVALSSRNDYLKLTLEDVQAASAMRHLDRIACPIAIATADLDSPEFKRQSKVFAEALAGMGRLASHTIVFAANHFQEPQRLATPDSELSRALFSLMKI